MNGSRCLLGRTAWRAQLTGQKREGASAGAACNAAVLCAQVVRLRQGSKNAGNCAQGLLVAMAAEAQSNEPTRQKKAKQKRGNDQ